MINTLSPLVKYIPAELHEGQISYITYFVINPATNKLHQKRIKVNRMKKITARRKWARDIIHEINIKLAAGWNPFIEAEAAKGYQRLNEVLDVFIKTKEKELRADSMRSYNSFVKIFKEHIVKYEKENELYIIMFNKNMATDFIQEIYLKNKISERCYNNHVAFYRSFFNWAIQMNYCVVNPFEGIKKKKVQQKNRIIIDSITINRIFNYLQENDYPYFICCLLAYYVFLRPKEITYLRFKDIELDKHTVTILSSVAKNGHERKPTIPNVLFEYLEKLKSNNNDQNDLIFSNDFLPGKNRICSRLIAKHWDRLRKKLDIPMEMQFYSLRDSGITQMLDDGVSPVQVMHQADHSSLEITSVYTKHIHNKASDDIMEMCSDF